MPIASSKGKSDPVPAGVQHAVCFQVIDVGTPPPSGNFPSRRKVLIVWELPNERINVEGADGHARDLPRAISKEYTLSLDKKANLRRDLESWRGRPFTAEESEGFEIGKLIGANCQINVVHKLSADGQRTYANVGAIMPLGKGTPKIEPENPTLVFDLPQQGPVDFPKEMPEWIVNKIKTSHEYQDLMNPQKQATEDQKANIDRNSPDEDVPF